MATDYPDIIGEYVLAPKRFEVDGLQYVGRFEPETIVPGETSSLRLHVQNTLNVPLNVQIKPNVPQTGRFRTQPLFNLGSTLIEFEMAEAEAGVLIVPITTTDQVITGTHQLGLEVKVTHSRNAEKIRKPKSKDPLKAIPIDSPVGLNLVGVVGVSYTTQNGKKSRISLAVTQGKADTTPEPDLTHSYQKLWDLDEAQRQHNAQIEVNKVRAEILEDLAVEPLFVAMYVETQQRFIEAGLRLRVGEAIAVSKLLAYTAHLFLSRSDLQDGLLCPIWERALFNKYPTTNISRVLKDVGYKHILKLSIAVGFGLIAEATGKYAWSLEERTGLAEYLSDALEEGSPLEIDFLYLPLMLAALRIVRQVRFSEEDVEETLMLMSQARTARTELFADEELQEVDRLYDTWLQQAMAEEK